jgi:hypothetical protein
LKNVIKSGRLFFVLNKLLSIFRKDFFSGALLFLLKELFFSLLNINQMVGVGGVHKKAGKLYKYYAVR